MFQCKVFLPERVLQPFDIQHLFCLQKTWKSQAGVWTAQQESWTWSIHHLVLSIIGSMGREMSTFYKHFADMSQKRQYPYPVVMRLAKMSTHIQSSRFYFHHPVYGSNISLAASEGWLPSVWLINLWEPFDYFVYTSFFILFIFWTTCTHMLYNTVYIFTPQKKWESSQTFTWM